MDLLCETEAFQIASPVVDAHANVVYVLCRATGTILALLPTAPGSASALEVVPIIHLSSQPESMLLDTLTPADAEAGTVARFIVADASGTASIQKVEVNVEAGHTLQDVLQEAGRSKRGLVVGAPAAGSYATASALVSTFEGMPLLGPNAVTLVEGGVAGPELLFTDGGATGESSLCDPRGCVYTTLNGRRQLVRVVGPGLAMPCGVAAYPQRNAASMTYITEMCTNRVLRLVKPEENSGVVHTSVFVQLSGGMGPVAVIVDPSSGDVYVATYDIECRGGAKEDGGEGEDGGNTGSVHVYDSRGELKGTIVVPSPRITGLAFDTTNPNTTAIFISTLTRRSEGSWASQLYRTLIGGDEEEEE